jgi:hypothetical protein
MKVYIPENFRSRVLLVPQATGTGAQAYLKPTGAVNAITIRAIATMGNATDLVLSLKYADDATGTNATDYPVDVPVYVGGVRQTDAKAYTIGAATGNFIVDFCVDPATVPAGKYVGLSYGDSNAANLLAAEFVEDSAFKPTATA